MQWQFLESLLGPQETTLDAVECLIVFSEFPLIDASNPEVCSSPHGSLWCNNASDRLRILDVLSDWAFRVCYLLNQK